MQSFGYALQVLGLVVVPMSFFYSDIRYGQLAVLAIGAGIFFVGNRFVKTNWRS